ncbi:MAG: tetratricopeptide repeat protein [Puniceicoccaceae bacterium]
MKESYNAYVPRDRLLALASAGDLPEQSAGTVLFADISGFTPLTEAFEAHLGSRLGGEELTRVLNEVYAMLIGEVDRVRGSVIGFAGDAITCWFEEDDGHRAVGCALAMQKGMEAFQAIPSPGGGSIGLGLKAAVTSGTVKRFAVGDESIQKVDVLAGDPVYRVAVVEGLAERGEVLIDPETRENLGGDAELGEERQDDTGQTLAWVIHSLVNPVEQEPWPNLGFLEVPPGLVDPWIISAIRNRISSGLGEFFTELRPATAMFVKFEGIDFEGDSQADKKLDAFFSWVQVIVNEYEGVVHQLTVGDKGSFLYAAFGAPISHEDDTLRTMAAALEIQQLTANLDFISAVRIGIGRGSTRTGAYGGPSRRTYGVLGDQVNLSARLMGKADPGEILVSEPAYKEGRRAFQLQTLPHIRVKGKSEPVAVFRLEGKSERSLATDGGEGSAFPMVGRKEELAAIENCLNRTREGFGQVVSLQADAGMGKSRLVAETAKLARSAGFRIYSGECQTFGNSTLYAPWWRIWREFFGLNPAIPVEEAEASLRRQLKTIDERLGPRLPLLGAVLDLQIADNELTRTFDAKLRRASLESMLVECLRHASEDNPILIVLEDAHAIDDVSGELFRSLVQAIARMPVMLLIARRPNNDNELFSEAESGLDYVVSLELPEFNSAEAAELISLKFAQLFGADQNVPEAVVETIARKTGGNPFFIDEVMNWLHHEQIEVTSVSDLEKADLPVSLYALVLSRMDQLNENSRITMKVASVVGRIFRAAVVWGVYPDLGGEREVRKALSALTENDFTSPDEEDAELAYLFKHVVIHEVAYESLTKQLRAILHEAIGLFLEKHYREENTQMLDLLAFHFGRSPNREKQRKYFLLAGDAAREAYAAGTAAGYYRSLLPLLDGPDKVPVLSNLGKVLEVTGDWKESMQTYEDALQLAESLQMEGEIANCRLDIGDLHRKTGAMEEAGKWLEQAREAYTALGDESGMGDVLHSEGTLAAQTGQYDKAREVYAQSIEIRRKLGQEKHVTSLLSNTGIILRFQGKLDEALDYQEEALAIRLKLNDPFYIGNSYNNLGMAKRYLGDLAGARKDLEKAMEYLQKVGDRGEIANTYNSLAEVALDQKDAAACEAYLLESLRVARELGNMRSLAFILETFAFNALNLEKPDRSLRLFGAAKAIRQSIGAPLPEADAKRVGQAIDEAGAMLQGVDLNAKVQEGATLPLSTALDYAAGVEDAEL